MQEPGVGMAADEFTIGGAVRFAWTTLRQHGRAIWGVLALNALADTLSGAGAMTQNTALSLIGMLGSLVTGFMLLGAVFRLTLADRHAGDERFKPRPLGLQWGAMETRMLGAGALVVMLVVFIGFLVLLAIQALAVGGVAAEGFNPAQLKTAEQLQAALTATFGPAWPLVALPLLAAIIYVSVRLSLIMPATADQGAIRIFRSWPLTRGAFWKILAASLLIQLPFLFALQAIDLSARAGGLGGPAVFAAALIAGVLSGAVLSPLSAALAAYLYRHLSPRTPA